jgi:multiple sugar transport system substrate-binding protein
MVQTKRRDVIKLAGATAAVASTGMAGILATGRAPAYAQQHTVRWLRSVDFVPASDALLRKELLPRAEKELGMKITLETVNGNDLQPRTTAAIQSGAGPDLIQAFNNYTYIYANSVVDLGDLAEDWARREGGLYKYCRSFASDGKMFMALPWAVIGSLVAYRKSWFDEAGASEFPKTWEEYRTVGRKLKSAGHPIGQTLGHTFGDAPGFTYSYLWSWGGKEVEADGKTVAINSKETIESVKFLSAFWKEACDEGALAWDDSNNNRAFLAGTVSATMNAVSIYVEASRKPDTYQTEKGTPMAKDILHAPLPAGPAGQFGMHLMYSDMLMKYSKNQDAAKAFLKWIHDEKNYGEWFNSQKGLSTPCTVKWEGNPLWNADPVITPFKVTARLGQTPGFAGLPNQKAAEVLAKYIVTDMYAKVVQGMAPEESVKWAEGELRKIYSA